MLKIKAGIDDKAVKKMKKPELIDRIGTMIEFLFSTIVQYGGIIIT